jgi:hypothetical protein
MALCLVDASLGAAASSNLLAAVKKAPDPGSGFATLFWAVGTVLDYKACHSLKYMYLRWKNCFFSLHNLRLCN